MVPVVVLTFAALCLWAMRRSAMKFAERQRKLGRWDAQGPLVETESPSRRGLEPWRDSQPPLGVYSPDRSMLERREVNGQYHGRILKDRRANSGSPTDAPAERASHPANPPHSPPPPPTDDWSPQPRVIRSRVQSSVAAELNDSKPSLAGARPSS